MAKKGDTKSKSLYVLGRYKVDASDFLGQGSFSVVRKGIDVRSGEEVAVKMYKIDPRQASPEEQKEIMIKFKHQVEVLTQLKESPKIDPQKVSSKSWAVNKSDPAIQIIQNLDPTAYFVQLIDFSKNKKGEPGPAEDGNVYIILELALYTLDDYLHDRRKCNKPMRMPDVQRVFKALTNMVALLHAHDYVHLDIKPENIMRTANGDWKLIDVDGAVRTNSKISVEENTISFTPLYCAPEFARVLVEDCDYVHISRLMDVWSIGLTSLDLLLSQPALEHKYTEIVEATGDCMGYFEWLSDRSIELGLPAQLERVDKDYYNMLQEHILVKDEKVRASIPEVMNHPFYNKDYTKRTQKSPREALPQKPADMDQKVEKDEYGVHANQSRRWDKVKQNEKQETAADGDEGAGGGATTGRRTSTVIEQGVAAKKNVDAPYGKAGMSQSIKNSGYKSTNVLKGVKCHVKDDVG